MSPYPVRRAHDRYDFPSTMEYTLTGSQDEGVLKGVTINLSVGGMSMYVYASHSVGQKITIVDVKGKDYLAGRKAYIVWIKEIDRELYRVGICFENLRS